VQRKAGGETGARGNQVPAKIGMSRTRLAERKSETDPHAIPQGRAELVMAEN
jgi:hypothetical protein